MLLKTLSRLPFRLLYVLAYLVYVFTYHILRARRNLVFDSLKRSFPEKSHEELKRISQRFYRNLADVLVEVIKSITLSKEQLKKRVHISNPEVLDEFTSSRQSVVLLASHQCNWEWLQLACCLKLPFALQGVYNPLSYKPADRVMLAARSRFGTRPIPMKNFMADIMKSRKEPKGLIIVADQSPRRADKKYWARFLNQDTAFFIGPQKVAWITQSPVMFMSMKRIRRGYYEVSLRLLARPPYAKNDYQIVERYAREVERQVREYPSDWLWSYERWKRKKLPISA